MQLTKKEECDQCLGKGKIKLYPLTDEPIWERENEEIEVECDLCKDV